MSTRCIIGYSDGKIHGMYSHYDSYPDHVGKILVKHHNSFAAMEAIIDGGQIRNFDNDGTICRFGHGPVHGAETYDNVKEVLSSGFDYVYLWSDDGCWKCWGKERGVVREFDIPGNRPWEA